MISNRSECEELERRKRRAALVATRALRILRFEERQNDKRQWIRLSTLAERVGREISTTEGYALLRAAILNGEFEKAGRSRLLYLHPETSMAKMTREKLKELEHWQGAGGTDIINIQYVGCCWVPFAMAMAWCRRNSVSVAGWMELHRAAPGRPEGSGVIDDAPALHAMHQHISQSKSRGDKPVLSVRKAALIVVARPDQGLRGNSPEAACDRLRRKYSKREKSKQETVG